MTYFGGKLHGTKIDNVTSYKIIAITTLLSGVVIWIYYRSFIVSELSVELQRYPFHDLESLSKTNYRLELILFHSKLFFKTWYIHRLVSGSKSTNYYAALTVDIPVYKKIMESNVDPETSFNSLSDSIDLTLKRPNTVLFYGKHVVLNMKEFECKVS